ncbi:MAG: ABC transporter ATP-binding protein [Planctomycetota bacterium]
MRYLVARARGERGPRAVRHALRGIDLAITQGSIIALVGANGSGKSTLIRLMGGAEPPTEGAVRLRGLDPRRASARARLGVAFQSPSLDPLLTIRENLRLHGRLYAMSQADIESATRRHAESLGVAERLDDRVGALSGGLARRTDLARVLLTDPDIVLLDEPSASLDAESRRELAALIRRMRDDSGATVVLSTHLLDEVREADRVIVLHDGAITLDLSADAWQNRTQQSRLRVSRIDAGGDDARVAEIVERFHLRPQPTPDGGWTVPILDDQRGAALAHAFAERGVAFEIGAPRIEDLVLTASHHERRERDEP